MNDFPIALQLYSVRNEIQNDFLGTLKQVKALGYDGVEFAGLFDKSPKEIKDMLFETGLIPVSAHVPFKEMMENPEILRDYAEIGCRFVVIPYLEPDYRPGAEKFDVVIEGAKMLGAKARELGMTLGYHNHDFEFVKIDGEYALDVLYREVSADLLETELDTCWVNVGGENPADYVLKYSGRATLVHLKDFVGNKTENMYSLIGIDSGDKKAETEKFEFRPVGYGKQDFPAILDAAKRAGAKWVIVEQDQPSLEKTPIECAEMSIKYLKSL